MLSSTYLKAVLRDVSPPSTPLLLANLTHPLDLTLIFTSVR